MKVNDNTVVAKEKAAYTLYTSDEGQESMVYDPTYQGHRLVSNTMNTKKGKKDPTGLDIGIDDDGITNDDLLGLYAAHNDLTYIHIDETLDDDLTNLAITDDQLPLDDDLDDVIQQLALTAISAVSAASIYIPRNYKEAMKSPQAAGWHKATYVEHDSLVEKKVFKVVPLPKGAKTISSKLVFKAKPKPTGDLSKLKARVVARGFQQRPGLDYEETFSPTARTTSIRILLAICVLLGWISAQSDVYVAFLNATLKHKLYVVPPPPFELPPGHVWLLLKSLYGLVQAPRAWYETLTAKLIELSFRVCLFDPCVYIHTTQNLILSVHVDDIRIYAANQHTIDNFLNQLSQAFAITSEDPDALYLGMHIEQGPDSIKIHQSEYVRRLLERFDLSNLPTVPTPCDHRDKLRRENDKIASTAMRKEYLQKFGSLNYLPAMTRIDIAYAASVYGRYNSNPTQLHLDGITRAYAYAKGTRDTGITYTRQNPRLLGYCDADWAGCLDTRRSTTGYMFTLAGGPISWSSAIQKVVAQSTCEAEYMALGEAVKEALWIKDFINDLGTIIRFDTVPIYVDNESAVKLAKNPEFHQRSKHIDIRHHFLRDHVRQGTIQVIWISGKENPADMLTKALDPVKFDKICRDIGI
jgi:hypothetical protein